MTALAEIRASLAFESASQAVVTELAPVLTPHVDRVVDRVLRGLAPAADRAARPVRPDALRRALCGWLDAALRGPHHDDDLARRHAVLSAIAPEVVVVAAVNTTRRELRGVIAAALADREVFLRASDALDRLLDVELAVCSRHRQLDADARLARREREAQAGKLAAMQSLTAGLAHEIRNPLNAATLQLELLDRRLRRSNAEPRVLDSAQLVHDEIGRLTGVLNAFLDFAQPPPLVAADHDLVAVVSDALEAERLVADAGNVALDLRTAERPVVVRVDAAKIHQVIRHLVRNAVAAASGGGCVEVEVSRDGDGVRVVVRDDGPGIAAEVLPRIWEPFFSTRDGGTGMGMSIVHSLVEQHGGRVEIRTSDHGTELEVRLQPQPDLRAGG